MKPFNRFSSINLPSLSSVIREELSGFQRPWVDREVDNSQYSSVVPNLLESPLFMMKVAVPLSASLRFISFRPIILRCDLPDRKDFGKELLIARKESNP